MSRFVAYQGNPVSLAENPFGKHLRPRSGHLALLILVTSLGGAGARADQAPTGCQPPCAQPVFTVKRTKNANELVYQANIVPDGFHQQVPLQVYWIMQTRGGEHEDLTNMERSKAYGLKFLGIAPHEVSFAVKALEGITFRAKETTGEDGASVAAYATVDGEEMAVHSVFIATRESGLIPKVLYIEFSGTSTATGEPTVRRIAPGASQGP